jgi:hypothetical protein
MFQDQVCVIISSFKWPINVSTAHILVLQFWFSHWASMMTVSSLPSRTL